MTTAAGLPPMRILAVQDSDWFERGPHQQHHLLERLSARGHQVRVIDYPILWRSGRALGDPGRRQVFPQSARLADGARVEVIRPPILKAPLVDFGSHLFTVAREVEAQCRDFRPDVLLGYGILSDLAAARAAHRHGLPYVAHLLDALHQLIEPPALRGLGRLLEARNLRSAARVVVINHALREYAVSLGARPERTEVLPTGVELERFRQDAGREEARRRLGLAPEDLALFFMGWIYRFSGVEELARRVVESSGEPAHLRLVVVGEGDSLEALRRLARTPSGGDRLILTGKQPYGDIPQLLSAADVCVLPAEVNATMRHIVPIKMYEYLAAGKPVLATELPGVIAEFGREGGVRFVPTPEAIPAAACALHREVGAARLRELALAHVRENDWSDITDRFEALLRRVCAGPCGAGVSSVEGVRR